MGHQNQSKALDGSVEFALRQVDLAQEKIGFDVGRIARDEDIENLARNGVVAVRDRRLGEGERIDGYGLLRARTGSAPHETGAKAENAKCQRQTMRHEPRAGAGLRLNDARRNCR